MTLSIIVPVYNENKNIIKTINNLHKLKKNIKKIEIIFIDDFSTDDTLNILNQSSKKKSYVKYEYFHLLYTYVHKFLLDCIII